MATQQMYTKCEESIKRVGIREVKSGKLVTINLGFFGIKSLVNESEFLSLSKSEQRRHEREDRLMATIYCCAEAE